MKGISISIVALAIATTPTQGQGQTRTVPDSADPTVADAAQGTALDSATAWPWRVLKRMSRLRQQEEALVWLPADNDGSTALVVSCLRLRDYLALAIRPPSPAAIEEVERFGAQLGSVVTVNYRWEDGDIHRADFAAQGGGHLLWHVYRNPLSGCDNEHPCVSEKLAHRLPEHRLLVAAWPSFEGGEDEATWTLPPTTGMVIASMRTRCQKSKR